MLISAFAGAAVRLAALGIYGVMAFSIALRMQEMAIRLVLASGARLAAAGCVLGASAAVFATRLLRSFLFQVGPLDPAVMLLAAASILLLSLAASLVPARGVS